MGTLDLVVHPGARRDSVSWDPARRLWTVECRAEASRGQANVAIARMLAGMLGVRAAELRWVRGSRSHRKVLAVGSLSDPEIRRRLEIALEPERPREGRV